MNTEVFYIGLDNSINLILKRRIPPATVYVALTNAEMDTITRMTIRLGTTLVDSDNGDTDPIRWRKTGYTTGEFRLFLGHEAITPGNYRAWLVVYDPTNPNGILWGIVPIEAIAEPPSSP